MVVVGSYAVSVVCTAFLVSQFHDLLLGDESEADFLLHDLHGRASGADLNQKP